MWYVVTNVPEQLVTAVFRVAVKRHFRVPSEHLVTTYLTSPSLVPEYQKYSPPPKYQIQSTYKYDYL